MDGEIQDDETESLKLSFVFFTLLFMNKFLEFYPRKPRKIDSMLPTLKLQKEDDMIKMLRQYALPITANKSSHNKVLSPGRVPLVEVEI